MLGHVSKSPTCHHKYLDRWKHFIYINGVPFVLWLSIPTQFRVPVVLEVVWVVYQCVGLWFKSLAVPLSLKDSLGKILKFLLPTVNFVGFKLQVVRTDHILTSKIFNVDTT